ncbi:hypothetical protein [Mucilaginibacter sp. dw_454]|uniref:hypothetical protein n=1 Tax=Mucilaginibacter sp. dw_454 TaxID=2720079 RepID=UPI001BD5136B|nr:hypothetical protein [Mucilaginibacter sp. dw_454]
MTGRIINTKHLLVLLLPLMVVCGCKKDNGTAPNPGITVLSFPDQNSICTTGTIISDAESSITFKWAATQHTEFYEVHVKNLLTNTESSKNSDSNQLTVNLLRNTPYSWYIVSRSSKSLVSSKSDVWKFYNAGAGVESHVPFPADVIGPLYGNTVSTGVTTLSWKGSDVDNDIVGYDVYLGTSATPPLFKSDVKTPYLNDVPVTAGNTYYWMIVTKDSQGNQSNSAIFQFSVR